MDSQNQLPHTLSHPLPLSLQQRSALDKIDDTYTALQLSLKLLFNSLENASGPARVYALALERDGGAPGATMYVENTSARKRRRKKNVVLQSGGEPEQLEIVDLGVTDVGAADAAQAEARGEQWVTKRHDAAALQAALKLYGKLDKDRDQPPWVSDRAPGIICSGDTNGATRRAVADVNLRKDNFKAAVQSLVVPRRAEMSRHRMIADYLPALRDTHLTQAYRHIQYIDEEVDRLTFGWSRSMRMVQFKTIDEVIEELKGYNRLDGDGRIERELQEEGVLWLARVQQIPPFPILNYWPLKPAPGEDKVLSIRCSAVMPVILRQAHLPPVYKGLQPFDSGTEPQRRRSAKKLESKPVFVLRNTGIAFYRYLKGVTPKPVLDAQAAAAAARSQGS